MIRHLRALGLFLAFPFSALAAQEVVFQGFETRPEVVPADAATRTLSDGRMLTWDGQSLDLWDTRGTLIQNLGLFPVAGEVGAFVVSPGESFALVGEKLTGTIFRVQLDGSGITPIDTLLRNTDAVFEGSGNYLVCAGTTISGPGYELWRLNVPTGTSELLASLPGTAGSVAIDSNGAAFCLPARLGETDTTTLYRFAPEELVALPGDVLAAIDGMLAVEVESIAPTGDWVEESSEAGFSGDSYFRWDGPDLFNSPGQGILSWTFEVYEAGEYQLRIHNLHNDNDSTQENDCWVRMDGGPWIKVFSGHDFPTWNWETVFDFEDEPSEPAEYDLGLGEHTIEISGRSNNFRIDRFHLFRTGTPNALSFSVPLSFQTSPLDAGDADIVATGFDGAAELVIGTNKNTILVGETDPVAGVSRIHALGQAFGFEPLLVESTGTTLEGLDFVGAPSDFFFPFQPEDNGELFYLVRDDVSQVLERRSLVPRRAQLELTGPGVSGIGAVNLELTEGWPHGTAFMIYSLASTLNPFETPINFAGFPFVHTPMNLAQVAVLEFPLPMNGNGDFTLPFSNGLGATGVVAMQMVLLTSTAAVVGSSETAIL